MMKCNSLSCRNASCFTSYTKAKQLGQSALLLFSVSPLLVSLCPCWSQFCPFWSLFPLLVLALPPADLSFLPVLGQPRATHLPNVHSLLAIISLYDCSQTVHKSSLDSNQASTASHKQPPLALSLLKCLTSTRECDIQQHCISDYMTTNNCVQPVATARLIAQHSKGMMWHATAGWVLYLPPNLYRWQV